MRPRFAVARVLREKPVKKPTAYLASPLGFSEAGRMFYYGKLLPALMKAGFRVLDPWKLTPAKEIASAANLPYGTKRRARWAAVNPIIAANNAHAIENADIIIAVLDGTDVDSGTAAEIGYGSALGKPSIGYRGDFRLASDNEGSMVNLQVEYFIRKNGGDIVCSVSALRSVLGHWAKRLL